MVETLIAASGSLIALGALVVSFLAHRHQVARAAALDEREGRVEAREKALERREQRVQASMIEVHARASRSVLHDGWVTPQLLVVNPSNQPIRDLAASYHGVAVPDVDGSVGPGTTRSFSLPPNDGRTEPLTHDITLFFTDAAGTRWRRDGGGGLHRGVRAADGRWEWLEREEPVIAESRAGDFLPEPQRLPGYGYPRPSGLPPRRALPRRRAALAVAAALVGLVVLIVLGIVMLGR